MNASSSNEKKQSHPSSSQSSYHELGLRLQFQVAQFITNCSRTKLRVDPPWEDLRQPGWTETWGNLNKHSTATATADDDDVMVWIEDNKDNEEKHDDNEQVGGGGDRVLNLIQYRVAWYEQLVLRVAQIPHEVQNSTFSCMESTGPLPVLKDTSVNSNEVYLVGQSHPDVTRRSHDGKCYHSHIVQHLQDQILLTKITGEEEYDDTTVQTYLLWIQTVLQQQILFTARYHDNATWYHVEKPTCRLAAAATDVDGSPSTTKSSSHFLGGYQAWAERVVALSEQQPNTLSLKQALDLANDSYQMVEQKLLSHKSNNDSEDNNTYLYLLGTKQPTLADCLLFDHLANALTNVHLIVVLAQYPKLVSYFQHLYQQYFDNNNSEQNKNNNKVNQCNAFLQQSVLVDLLASSNNDETSNTKLMQDIPNCKTAVELMQSLALHHISHSKDKQQQDLVKVVKNIKEIRQSQEDILNENDNGKNTFTTLKRWLNGGDIFSKPSSPPPKEEEKGKSEDVYEEMNRKRREQLKKLKQQSITQDQIWISSVALITGFTMLLGVAKSSMA